MTPREELEALRRIAELEGKQATARDSGVRGVLNEAGNAIGGGAARGLFGTLGFPASVVNSALKLSFAIPKQLGYDTGEAPQLVGEADDIQRLVEALDGSKMPSAKTKVGKVAESAIAGGVGALLGGGAKPPVKTGLLSGALGETVNQTTDNRYAAAAASMLPFLTKGAWDTFRPRVAENTAKNLLRNVNADEMDETFAKIKDFSPHGKMMPAQALPPHSQAAGLAQNLAGRPEGMPIVDALVKQQRAPVGGHSPVQQMQQAYQTQIDDLFAQADKVKPTRATKAALLKEVRQLPKQLGSNQSTEVAKSLRKNEIAELSRVLHDRTLTARQLSVHADSLGAKRDYIPGAGPFYPAASGRVAAAAEKTHPAVRQANDLARRKHELTEALEQVRIPGSGGIAGVDPRAAPQNVVIGVGGKAMGSDLVADAAITRIARGLILGQPEKKLAEALADPTMKKLTALAGSTRTGDFSAEALRAELQRQLQMNQEE